MCLYEPPLFLGTPELSAAAACALPLAASATRWSELLAAVAGLAFAFVAAHAFIIAWHHESPPSVFYWGREQGWVVPFSLGFLAFELTLLYALSSVARYLWRAEYVSAVGHFLLALALLAAVIGLFACLAQDARALSFEFLASNGGQSDAAAPKQEIVLVSCWFPPFGEGLPGYFMLAVLTIFQVLVAVGVANALKRKFAG